MWGEVKGDPRTTALCLVWEQPVQIRGLEKTKPIKHKGSGSLPMKIRQLVKVNKRNKMLINSKNMFKNTEKQKGQKKQSDHSSPHGSAVKSTYITIIV